MSIQVASVVNVQGEVSVRAVDGSTRSLSQGDALYPGEVLILEDGAELVLDYGSSELAHIVGPQQVLLSEEQLLSVNIDQSDSEVVDPTIAQVEEALARDGDILDELEEPAAGSDVAPEGGGSSFVRLTRISESVDPLAYDFAQSSVSTFDVIQGDASVTDVVDDEGSIIEESYSEQLVAEANPPVISGPDEDGNATVTPGPDNDQVTIEVGSNDPIVVEEDEDGTWSVTDGDIPAGGSLDPETGVVTLPPSYIEDETVTATGDEEGKDPSDPVSEEFPSTAEINVSLADVNSDNVAEAPITGDTDGVEADQVVSLVISDGTNTVTASATVDSEGNYGVAHDFWRWAKRILLKRTDRQSVCFCDSLLRNR